MKTYTTPIVLAAALLAFYSPKMEAQSLVEFGPLYGYQHNSLPTSVIDGNGDSLGTSLEGVGLWFLCLDKSADDPSNISPYQWEYSLSANSSILTSGVWGGITVADDRESIINGITNIFFNNDAAIYADTGSVGSYDTPGSAMQLAAWAIIDGYGSTWSGVLNETAIDSIIASDPGISGSLMEDFLYSSLIANPNANGRVFFGEPAGTTPGDFQSVLFFAPYPIPEPSSALLVGLAGSLAFLRRRRNS